MTENAQSGSEEAPPKTFHGMGGVLIFVGIAVMISLVWTQFRQAQRRGSQTLELHGRITPTQFSDLLGGRQVSIPDKERSFLILGVVEPGHNSGKSEVLLRMRDVAKFLDQMRDRRVRLVLLPFSPANTDRNTIREWAHGLEITPPRWSIVGEDLQTLREWISRELFAPLLAEGEEMQRAPSRMVLLDPNGGIRSYRDAENPGSGGNLLNDLGALAREFPENSLRSDAERSDDVSQR